MNIEQVKQNHPELVVSQLKEIAPNINGDAIRKILKYTGVNKWLKNRKYIIHLKNLWKQEICELQVYSQHYKDMGNMKMYYKLNERMTVLSDCRQQIRTICHSNRETSFPKHTTSFYKIGNLPKHFPKRPSTQFLKKKGL